MLKKIYLSCALSLISISVSGTAIDSLKSQLNHINSQINVAKRSWNEARARIKRLEGQAPALYAKLKLTFDKLIATDVFVNQMNTDVEQQYDSIVNKYSSFKAVKAEHSITKLFPNLTMREFGQTLYSAMASKAYCYLLGQKLSQKAKEVAATIIAAEKTITSSV